MSDDKVLTCQIVNVAVKVNQQGDATKSSSVTVGYRINWSTGDGSGISEVYYTHGPADALLSNWHIDDFSELRGKDAVGKLVKLKRSERVVEVGVGRNKTKVRIPAERDHLVLLSEIKVGYG